MQILNLYNNQNTYRGIAFDPHAKKETEVRTFVETYRGVKHEETKEVIKAKQVKETKLHNAQLCMAGHCPTKVK